MKYSHFYAYAVLHFFRVKTGKITILTRKNDATLPARCRNCHNFGNESSSFARQFPLPKIGPRSYNPLSLSEIQDPPHNPCCRCLLVDYAKNCAL